MSPSKRRRLLLLDEQPNVIEPTSPAPEEVINDVPKLDELVKIMEDLQKDNVEDVVDALSYLYDAFYRVDEGTQNIKKAIDLGMIGTLVTSMKRWSEDESVQEGTCECLAILAFDGDDAAVVVARMGGVEAVVSAMRLFPGLQHVQASCLYMLGTVLYASDHAKQPIQEVTKRFVEDFNGVDLTIQAMELFPDNDKVQGTGLEVLHNISFSGYYHSTLFKARAVSNVARALEQHPENYFFQTTSTRFMTNMFW